MSLDKTSDPGIVVAYSCLSSLSPFGNCMLPKQIISLVDIVQSADGANSPREWLQPAGSPSPANYHKLTHVLPHVQLDYTSKDKCTVLEENSHLILVYEGDPIQSGMFGNIPARVTFRVELVTESIDSKPSKIVFEHLIKTNFFLNIDTVLDLKANSGSKPFDLNDGRIFSTRQSNVCKEQPMYQWSTPDIYTRRITERWSTEPSPVKLKKQGYMIFTSSDLAVLVKIKKITNITPI